MKQLYKEGISVIQAAIDLVSNTVTVAGCVDVAAKIDVNEYGQNFTETMKV